MPTVNENRRDWQYWCCWLSSLGDGQGFKNRRHASVYIGATPKQFSIGGKVVMLGININMGVTKHYAQSFIKAQYPLSHDCQCCSNVQVTLAN
jgi:hypothetical protein